MLPTFVSASNRSRDEVQTLRVVALQCGVEGASAANVGAAKTCSHLGHLFCITAASDEKWACTNNALEFTCRDLCVNAPAESIECKNCLFPEYQRCEDRFLADMQQCDDL